MTKITENHIEAFAIELLTKLGYEYIYAPDIAPDNDNNSNSQDQRLSFSQVLLLSRLECAVNRINQGLPNNSILEALKEVQRIFTPDLLTNNETFHRFLTEGIPV